MKARYIRVSSSSQNNARQLAKQHPDETLFIDVISGGVPFNERPQAKKLLFEIALGNVESIAVSSVDRIGRNAFDIQHTINHFYNHKVELKVDNLGISSMVNGKPNSIFKMICDVLSNVSAMEREALLERQREGIDAARNKNPDAYKGRVAGTVDTPEQTLAKHKLLVKVIKAYPTESLRNLSKLAADEDKGYKVTPNTVKKVKEILDKQVKEKGIN